MTSESRRIMTPGCVPYYGRRCSQDFRARKAPHSHGVADHMVTRHRLPLGSFRMTS